MKAGFQIEIDHDDDFVTVVFSESVTELKIPYTHAIILGADLIDHAKQIEKVKKITDPTLTAGQALL